MMGDVRNNYDNIYLGGKNGPLVLDLIQAIGKFKLSEAGMGWKNATTGQILTVSAADIQSAQWLKAAREYEIRITKKDATVLKFDGFPLDVSHLI